MGLAVEILNNDPCLIYNEKEKDGVRVSIILAHFLTKRIGEISPGADIREWRWIDINDLDKENLAPNIKPVLKHFGF